MGRKYETELMVHALVYGYVLSRPQDLETAKEIPRANETYLYLIGSRPRVRLDPATAINEDGEIRVRGTLAIRDDAQPFEARLPHSYGKQVFLECPYPFEQYALRRIGSGVLSGGVVADLNANGGSGIPRQAAEFEVLYVGQAYGSGGERSAMERLRRHETLQKILAEATPDVQVWLALCRLDDFTLIASIGGSDAKIRGREDSDHYRRALSWLNSDGPSRHEAVSLAEACLIRYFQPHYNRQLKSGFPQPQHAVLRALSDLDLHSIGVELQLQDIKVRAGNRHVRPARWHARMFETHFDPARGPILDVRGPMTRGSTARGSQLHQGR